VLQATERYILAAEHATSLVSCCVHSAFSIHYCVDTC